MQISNKSSHCFSQAVPRVSDQCYHDNTVFIFNIYKEPMCHQANPHCPNESYQEWCWDYRHEKCSCELSYRTVGFFEVLKFRQWPIFSFFTILFSRMGLQKLSTAMGSSFFWGVISQMIIREFHGIYVPQKKLTIRYHAYSFLSLVWLPLQIRDAIALCEYFAWLEKEVPKGNVTELSGAHQLELYRRLILFCGNLMLIMWSC